MSTINIIASIPNQRKAGQWEITSKATNQMVEILRRDFLTTKDTKYTINKFFIL